MKTVLNFSEVPVPQEFIPTLSKGLDYKVSTEKKPNIEIIGGVEQVAKNMTIDEANYFRYEILNVLEKEKKREHINISEKECIKIKKVAKRKQIGAY